MSEYVYRLFSDNGMQSLAALTPAEAGDFVERALDRGSENVEVERVPREQVPDLNDAWNLKRILATGGTT